MTSAERRVARYQRRKAERLAKRQKAIGKYDDFSRLSSTSALIRAHWEARKGVMWKASVARHDIRFFKNALHNKRALRKKKDIRQGFYHFQIVERGKPRDIHSLHYNERVIRRSACTNALVPILSRSLIYDNTASLKGKGVSMANRRCEQMLHRHFRRTGGNDGYILIIDYRKFFANIRHDSLMEEYHKRIQDPDLLWLTDLFVGADGENGVGLHIGPEDSQILAIAHPNRIDHLVKDVWRMPYYGRYMDDSNAIGEKAKLFEVREKLMIEFDRQGIIANPKKTQIVKLSRGFTYLKTKYYLQPNGRIVKKPDHDNIVRERRKLKKFKRYVEKGLMTLEQVGCSFMSWHGCMLRKNAHYTMQVMRSFFYSLFHARPWAKKKKGEHKHGYDQSKRLDGRNHGLQVAAQ